MKFYFTVLAAVVFAALAARAQTTVFTYQGRLNSNSVSVTGSFDLRFQIYNASSVVVAGPLTNASVGVTNGLFTVPLDFGAGVFDGSTRSLEIGVRTNGDTNAYVVLSPRQPLTSAPYAIQSLNAVNASNAMTLTAPLPATNMVGTIPNSLLSPNVAVLTNNVIFSGSVTAATFTGNGAGLTGLNASSISSGTLSDTRLTPNVALQSNPNLNFAGTVSATNFTGAGHGLTNVPGAFFWVIVATTNTLAQPNVGYICTNDVVPVTIKLPLSAALSVGDTFRVAGVGGAGWIVAQTNNQTILAGNLSDSIGVNWVARDSSRAWSAVASSADGTKLVAAVKGGQIYTSINSGVTWAAQDNSRNWSSVASSADGTKLVAGVGNNASLIGNIYASVNSGLGWSPYDSQRQWISVASAADGTKLVAAVYGNSGSGNPGAYISSSSGTGWSRTLGASFCSSVASSADGTKLVATVYSGQIWTSTDSGSSWVERDISRNWTAVASSADGSRLLAAVSGGLLYISYNSGTNWAAVNTGIMVSWTAVASSADGSRLVAVASSGDVYISTDSGVTWAQRFGLPAASWTGAACSADGNKLVLVANGDKIYTSSQGGTTAGPTGYLFGPQHSAIELIYAGTNLFLPLNHEGTIRAY